MRMIMSAPARMRRLRMDDAMKPAVADASGGRPLTQQGENFAVTIAGHQPHAATKQRDGDGNGENHSVSEASCARLFGPQIRPQFGPRDTSLLFNRQHEFGGHALLGAREPIPNLGLRRPDTIG
jgi:hypothetical protein